jgi:PAS domain S-box-containing protein
MLDDPPPQPDGGVAAAILRWRQRVASRMLGVLGGLGLVLLLGFTPQLIAGGAYGTIAFGAGLIGTNLLLATRPSLPSILRVSWPSFNLVTSGIATLVTGGDHGLTVAYLLGGIFSAALLIGWEGAAIVAGLSAALFAAGAAGYATGVLPFQVLVLTDINSPLGWLGLASVTLVIAIHAIIATELIFRQLRGLLNAQNLARRDRERALADVMVATEQRAELAARVAAEQAAAAALSRTLTEALESVQAGLWELDIATGHVTWSPAMFNLLGYDPANDMPSQELWRRRTHPDDYAHMLSLPPIERRTLDHRLVFPNGDVRWARLKLHTQLGEDGRPSRLRGLVTDITAERAAAARIGRLAEVANRTANPVVVTNLAGHIEWVNDAFTRVSGWALDEVVGKTPGSILQGPRTDPSACAVMSAAVRDQAPFDVEVLNYSRSGRQYWVQIEARVARDDQGNPVGFVAVETDVTEQRIASRRDSLAQRVAAVLLANDSVEEAAPRLVAELVAELDVLTAQIWLVENGKPTLSYIAGAAADATGHDGQDFLATTRAIRYAPGTDFVVGVGVPGVAWGTRKTAVLANFEQSGGPERKSRRLQVAQAAGLQTFFATPILGPSGVLGVIELGGTAYYPGHELLPTLIERIAEQVSSFLRHVASRRAFQSAFENSPDAMLLVDDTGQVCGANTRANDLFGDLDRAPIDRLITDGHTIVRRTLQPDADAASGLSRCEAHGKSGLFSAEISAGASEGRAIIAVRDLTERHAMEAALTRSLREKEMLLKEVHHRVKNNLQIVSSLLTLQADGLEPGQSRSALDEMVLRVRSMSYVHQQLYGTDHLDGVDLGDYARTLSGAMRASIGPDAALNLQVEPVQVSIDVAVPVGLILNELITNALKHGRDTEGACTLTIAVRRDADAIVLQVADRGPGFPQSPASTGSLGMQLIRSLTRQLRGKLALSSEGGATATLRIPAE